MPRKILMLGLLATLLAAPGLYAQTAPAVATPPAAAPAAKPAVTPPPAANPVDPASIQALKDMGAYLQTLKRFSVTTDLSGERVLEDGQKLQHTATAEMDVERPNMFRAKMFSARFERELFYDGKVATLYTPSQKYYSTVPFTDNLGVLAVRLEERYGVQIPLSDLFLWGTPAAPVDKIESAMYAGQDYIGDDLCDHYAFRQDMIDWQIWISAGASPLPRRIVITNRSDDARPQSISQLHWNLKPTFTHAVFTFTPPKGATKVELLPLKTK